MKVLLTGATGYIGKRILPVLLKEGHQVVCTVRDKDRFETESDSANIEVVEVDFLNEDSLSAIPNDIDVAYYLIHSMNASIEEFEDLELQCALNFRKAIEATEARQVIYLSGIVNDENLSPHLNSRRTVEKNLVSSSYALTTLRAGIIIGSGSASFEIIRDLVEKLPIMVAPKWLKTRSQPVAIKNVIEFLIGVLNFEPAFNESFDIGGPEILTYKEILLGFARERGLKRTIITVPVMTPRLSSYWLYFVTATSYKLAVNLVDSMQVEVIGKPNDLARDLNIRLIPFSEAIQRAFDKIRQHEVVSSWTDAMSGDILKGGIHNYLQVPTYGCFRDEKKALVLNEKATLENIWSIGGKKGWYYGNWLWHIRGLMDKAIGGVGLRRGRKNPDTLEAGETLDFWRVLYASKEEKRLLLYAEMRLPGEAWLEFKIIGNRMWQTATFRPKGVLGRIYWYGVLPFHVFIFQGMAKRIAK